MAWLGWGSPCWFPRSVQEVASRAGMHTSVQYSQELCRLPLKRGSVVGAPWVWRCFREGLWSMCICQSSGSGWLLVSLLGVLSRQSCPIEESVFAPVGVVGGTVVFTPGGPGAWGFEVTRRYYVSLLDWLHSVVSMDQEWSSSVEALCG